MTYVGVEHELGEWLGSCDFVAPNMTTWKPKDQGPGIGDGPMGSNWMMDIVMKCHEMSSFNLVINQFIKGI